MDFLIMLIALASLDSFVWIGLTSWLEAEPLLLQNIALQHILAWNHFELLSTNVRCEA